MKVIPSATVSSKFFSVSANTVPCRGGKSLGSNASPRAEQGQLWGCRNTNRSSLCCRARSRTNSQLACHKPHEKGPRFTAGSPSPGSRRCSEEVVGPALRRPQLAERVPVQLLPSGPCGGDQWALRGPGSRLQLPGSEPPTLTGGVQAPTDRPVRRGRAPSPRPSPSRSPRA